MTDEITRLDDRTVERIAAGEVVERPASVVKELVENAVDADASRIEVAVENGGIEGIRVSDDGVGMTRDQVRRAVEKHTTSKIEDVEDLERGVGTLGFRGEALHAIGAVSRTTISTRPRGGDVGTELVLEGGEVTDVGPAGCPEGTTVAVEDLFYNVPARRKYLGEPATEFAHVNTVVTSYALAEPDVAVSLKHDGRETFATTGQGDLRETVLSVYGREVAEAMVPVEATGEDLPEGPLDAVRGLVSHPETNRASREYCTTFVNGRYVRASAVREAAVDAYGTQLAPDRYPFTVLFLEIDPATVDVNVHPRKLEVRFADEAGMREQVETAVADALLDAGLVRSRAPRGRSAPEQAELSPGGPDADDGESGTEEPSQAATPDDDSHEGTGRSSDDAARPTDERAGSTADASSGGADADDSTAETDTDASAASTDADASAAGPDVDVSTAGPSPDESTVRADAGDATESADAGQQTGTRRDALEGTGSTAAGERSGTAERDAESASFRGGAEQARLGGADPQTSFDSLPSMRVLGQFRNTYVVAETADGLVLVDQHAADERINYERLREAVTGETTTQVLAEPVAVELTAREAATFEERREALARLGFRAELVDDRVARVSTVPGVVADAADPELVRDVLAALVETDGDDERAAETVEAAADEVLADLACYPSVTGNTSLTEGSVLDLLEALDDCENPYACPHGRPVIVEFDDAEIDDRFERDYPGHGGRRE